MLSAQVKLLSVKPWRLEDVLGKPLAAEGSFPRSPMTGRLERIEKAFEEFRSKIADCRNEATSDMADIRDAYERFYSLRERYRHEVKAHTLGPTEEAALHKVFRDDKFIESVGKVRGISTHVETSDVELLDTDNVRVTITAKSSAAVVFAARTALLIDNQGQIFRLNHLKRKRNGASDAQSQRLEGPVGGDMTSDSDDLEHQLQENLRLRRELAAEVAKAKAISQSSGIAYRLGWVIYWTCITLAVCWILGLPLSGADGSLAQALDFLVRRLSEDPLPVTLIWLGPAVILYGIGRGIRYVLSGE